MADAAVVLYFARARDAHSRRCLGRHRARPPVVRRQDQGVALRRDLHPAEPEVLPTSAGIFSGLVARFGNDRSGKRPLFSENLCYVAWKVISTPRGSISAVTSGAFIVRLREAGEASFALPPERKPRVERSFNGIVRFPAPDRKASIRLLSPTRRGSIWTETASRRGRLEPRRSGCPGL